MNDKYYLSERMKKYINSLDDTYNVNGGGLLINRTISCTKTTREGYSRADSSDYICKELMENQNIKGMDVTKYRIRKLTPRECYRLMGFSDDDFDSASKVTSESNLYKQAGNSIVVNVLMEIFREML